MRSAPAVRTGFVACLTSAQTRSLEAWNQHRPETVSTASLSLTPAECCSPATKAAAFTVGTFLGANAFVSSSFRKLNLKKTNFFSVSDALFGHDIRVSCVDVSYDGSCLATGSFDTMIKIWN